MKISEVRIKTTEEFTPNGDRLVGFASFLIDDAFLVRDVKIVRGDDGLFVSMPSRKLTERCDGCGSKVTIRAHYCGHCGAAQPRREARRDERGGRSSTPTSATRSRPRPGRRSRMR